MLNIISNYHWRQFEYFFELSEKDKSELDWVKDDTTLCFHYRGNVYSLDEFMRIDKRQFDNNDEFQNWDGYNPDSFFSGILIKINQEDNDYYQVATYIG